MIKYFPKRCTPSEKGVIQPRLTIYDSRLSNLDLDSRLTIDLPSSARPTTGPLAADGVYSRLTIDHSRPPTLRLRSVPMAIGIRPLSGSFTHDSRFTIYDSRFSILDSRFSTHDTFLAVILKPGSVTVREITFPSPSEKLTIVDGAPLYMYLLSPIL